MSKKSLLIGLISLMVVFIVFVYTSGNDSRKINIVFMDSQINKYINKLRQAPSQKESLYTDIITEPIIRAI